MMPQVTILGSLGDFLASLIPLGLGTLMLLSPIEFSRLLQRLAWPQRILLRFGSMFNLYWPERVAQSRPLRIQIRVIGGIFLMFGIRLATSK